ncbi:DUF3352 domain-containing protein [Tenacibaculum finnmarkense]|uniref:DUF3352 domain-containing protein n=1 Tax=Tenacibaculum finnmarkense TaxID=2781243 RepID=UPI001EFB3CD7|nr:DUF3352 domain-containing protein [Tenacibaculum finnmarkense]MCG8902424.1 DUF3352 domain-containing protein [Tenacibaculum finnmarkense]
MKKKILWTALIAFLSFLAYQTYLFTFDNQDNIKPIYLVPKDAVFILDTQRPIDTWDEISASPIWKHFQKNSYFKELSKSLNTLDNTIKEQKSIVSFIGERDVLISAHVYKPKKYDFLYVVNIGKLSKLNFLKNTITGLAGSDFQITNRIYQKQEITEIYDKKARETLYVSFIKNQLIASYTHVLVENSINQYQKPIIGRDVNFIEITKETPDDGFFKLFFQYKYLNNFIACFADKTNKKTIENIQNSLYYSGFDVSLIEGTIIQADGYTNVKENSESYLTAIQKSGKGKRTVASIAPKNTALYLSFAFDSFELFHENFENLRKEKPKEFEVYSKQIAEIEEKLDISIKKNVYSWIGNEVALIHFNSSLSRNKKDIAAVFKTTNIDDATENLEFILSQIKEKTPLQFKQITYKNHHINFLDLNGFFKIIVGNMFQKMEKPYFTIIDDFVVFSTSPNTLKEIINNHQNKYTLASSKEFEEFNYLFNTKSTIFTYVNTPYLYTDLVSLADRKTQIQLKKNKNNVICFNQFGLQLTSEGSIFKSSITTTFNNPKLVLEKITLDKQLKKEKALKLASKKNSTITNTVNTKKDLFNFKEIHPSDLSASTYKEYYKNGNLWFEVALKDGLLDGKFRMYYQNGKLKLKGSYKNGKKSSTWRAYDAQENKLLIKKGF